MFVLECAQMLFVELYLYCTALTALSRIYHFMEKAPTVKILFSNFKAAVVSPKGKNQQCKGA